MNQSFNINNLINLPNIKSREDLDKLIKETQIEKQLKSIKRKREILYKRNIVKFQRNSVSYIKK